MSLALGYLARENFATDPNIGLFGGGYAALAQLEVRPSQGVNLGLTYVRAYYPTGAVAVTAGTGSRLANAPFGNLATSADHLGVQSSLRLGPGVNLSGWAGLSFANAETSGGAVTAGDSATLFNWALTLGLPNLGGRGKPGRGDCGTASQSDRQYQRPGGWSLGLAPGDLLPLSGERIRFADSRLFCGAQS